MLSEAKVDRRVKYTEPRKDFLLKIPYSVFNRLQEIANEKGLTMTETINTLILSSIDNEYATELAKSLKELNKEIKKWKCVAEKQQNMITQIQAKLKNDVLSLYMSIEVDPELKNFVEKFREQYVKVISERKSDAEREQTRKAWTNIIYRKFEESVIKKGKIIKSEKLARNMIKTVLKQMEPE